MEASYQIEYYGKNYPVFEISITVDGNPETACVSVVSLNKAIMPDGIYLDVDAKSIDESIFFYIPDEMTCRPEKEIREFIESNI